MQIQEGPPPAELPGRTKNQEAFMLAYQLTPGRWFVWENPPKCWKQTAKGWKLPIRYYQDAKKRVIIAHNAVATQEESQTGTFPGGAGAARPGRATPLR